jgi:hypothetical protein
MADEIRCADHAIAYNHERRLYLAGSGRPTVGTVRLRTKSHGSVFLLVFIKGDKKQEST